MPLIEPKKDQLVAVEKFADVDGAFIGDQMGTGKTVTAIERDFWLRKDYNEIASRPTLIVCEKIGLDVWDYHLRAMGVDPSNIIVIDAKNRKPFEEALEDLREDLFRKRLPKYRYFIVHYDAIRLLSDTLLASPHPIVWGHIIADEFHFIKNPKAIRTKYFKRVKGLKKTGLTGTPADDKPQDIWSLLNWLYPRQFSSYWKWFHTYLESEEKIRHEWYIDSSGRKRFRETGYTEVVGVKNIFQLHKVIDPFYIRRLLTEVEPDMPEKIHVMPPVMVDMTPAQRRSYDSMRKKSLSRILDIDGRSFVVIAPAVVAVITRLQQMALGTLTAEWRDEEDEEFPTLKISKPSPKLDAVMDIITNHEDEPFVIFTQFRGMADLVEEECQRKGITVVKIHGGVTSHRGELVRRFQDGEARVFVGTIAAAGKTITLSRAHIALFTDRSWNPNRNEQAEARLWRRTQRNAVRIYEIQMRNSIDQIRAETIKTKAELVEAINNG